MNNLTPKRPEPQTEAEYEAAVDELLAEMRRMQETIEPEPERRDAALLQELVEMRQELRELTQTVRQMQTEMRHDRDMAARSQETMFLRLENRLLRSERHSPLGSLLGELPPPQ